MFEKSDLKNGMIVETREGTRYIVVNEYLIGLSSWDNLDNYDDDLSSCVGYDELDIVLVFKTLPKSFQLLVEYTPLDEEILYRETDKEEIDLIANYEKAKAELEEWRNKYLK